MSFWLVAPSHPVAETCTDPGHLQVHSCSALVFPDYFKIGCMYLSKSFLFERYVHGPYPRPLHVLLYQLPYVLKQPRTKKSKKKSQASWGNTSSEWPYQGWWPWSASRERLQKTEVFIWSIAVTQRCDGGKCRGWLQTWISKWWSSLHVIGQFWRVYHHPWRDQSLQWKRRFCHGQVWRKVQRKWCQDWLPFPGGHVSIPALGIKGVPADRRDQRAVRNIGPVIKLHAYF